MGRSLDQVIAAMTGGQSGQLGWFSYDVPTDSWTWSATLFQIHGFEPGEIVPSTAVLAAHKHPEDRVHTEQVLAGVLADGLPFCCRHRIINTRQAVRTVVSIGRGVLDDAGAVIGVTGYFVDITDAAEQVAAAIVTKAVESSAAGRAQIEQAKGALMAVQGVSADDAFAILRWHSSNGNVKLRDLARMIVDGVGQPYTGAETVGQRIGRLLSGVVDGSGQAGGAAERRP